MYQSNSTTFHYTHTRHSHSHTHSLTFAPELHIEVPRRGVQGHLAGGGRISHRGIISLSVDISIRGGGRREVYIAFLGDPIFMRLFQSPLLGPFEVHNPIKRLESTRLYPCKYIAYTQHHSVGDVAVGDGV
jgi:hypothetical protein